MCCVPAVKSLLLHIYLAHRDWLPNGAVSSMHQATVQQLLFSLVGKVHHASKLHLRPTVLFSELHKGLPHASLDVLLCPSCIQSSALLFAQLLILCCMIADGMRAYFLPPRFYSRYYPYTGVKTKMVTLELTQV